MDPLVYIIILVYNGKNWIDSCLDSIHKTEYSNYKVVVIDNASPDGSGSHVQDRYPQVELIMNKSNLGFAGGNNTGITHALNNGAKYVVLQNQDTTVDNKWLSYLVNTAESIKEAGILSPMQYDYDGKALDRNMVNIINNSLYENDEYIEVDRVIGASIVIKREVVEKIGLLDPIYFCYFEESDLCRRAIYHNFKIVVVKNSYIYHWHTLVKVDNKNKKLNKLLRRNEFIYSLKDLNHNICWNFNNYLFRKLSDRTDKYGTIEGILRFILFIIKLFPILVLFPAIYFKRMKDIRVKKKL